MTVSTNAILAFGFDMGDEPPVDAAFALHVGVEHGPGHVSMNAGARTAAADFYEIHVHGTGGHGAYPQRAVDTVVVSGTITAVTPSLYTAMDSAAIDALPASARQELVYELADVYEYRVDMSRDLQVGDRFSVVAERRRLSFGVEQITRMSRVLGATMTLSGRTTEAVRFRSVTGGLYFDQDGKPMRSGFLRTPVAFRRISSGFGMRRHPILGYRRMHAGIDFKASHGTPIYAAADGTVSMAGRNGGGREGRRDHAAQHSARGGRRMGRSIRGDPFEQAPARGGRRAAAVEPA